MKKLFFLIVSFLFVCISMNGQVASNNSNIEYRGGSFYQNDVKLTSDQLCTILGQQTYEEIYKPAKGMRTAGIVCLSVGGAATALGAGLLIAGLAPNSSPSSSFGDVAMGMISVYFWGPGIAVTTAGAILLASGNKKLKNIVPASSGAGLAFAF